ncbi:MAG: helix-turn-helix transcriptional regulator [Clostridia bacterium]|nr:helix-turn-helix transcriptional regulator [Clostridia bacterium]
MDQIKIGKFIAERRKAVELTQMQLAEKLNITDRAVSKWETGKSMPDSSLMLALCDILRITVNDLLCGKVVEMENFNKEMENNLLEAVKEKEESDKRLLFLEITVGLVLLIPLAVSALIVSLTELEEWLQVLLVLTSLAPLLIATPFMIRIEQKAGYYRCKVCGHLHVPRYESVFFAMHFGRTRYMRCPKCGKMSWQKKTLRKD